MNERLVFVLLRDADNGDDMEYDSLHTSLSAAMRAAAPTGRPRWASRPVMPISNEWILDTVVQSTGECRVLSPEHWLVDFIILPEPLSFDEAF